MRTRPAVASLGVLSFLLVLTGACTTSTSTGPGSSAPSPGSAESLASSSPSKTPTASTVITVLKEDAVPLAQLKSFHPVRVQQTTRAIRAVSPDGDVLELDASGTDADPSDDQLVMVNADRGEEVVVPRAAHAAGQQVLDAAISDQWIVWREKPGTELGIENWRLYAYDRTSRRTVELTSAEALAGVGRTRDIPATPGGSKPSISGDSVFLSARTDLTRDGSVRIFRIPMDDPAQAVNLGPGRGAVALRGRLYFARRSHSGKVAVYTSAIDASERSVAARPSAGCTFSEFGPSAHGVVWTEECSEDSRLHIPAAEGEFTLREASLYYLATSSDLVAFATAEPSGAYAQFFFVPSTGRLIRLASGDSASGITVMGGPFLAWKEFTAAQGTSGRVHLVQQRS